MNIKPTFKVPDSAFDQQRHFGFHNVALEILRNGDICGTEPAFVDTGFSGFLMIPEEFIERYFLMPVPVAYTKVFTTAGTYETKIIKIDVMLGGVRFDSVDALVAPEGSMVQAMIGAKFLHFFVVGIREGKVTLTPNWNALSMLEEAEAFGTKGRRSLRGLLLRGTKEGGGRA